MSQIRLFCNYNYIRFCTRQALLYRRINKMYLNTPLAQCRGQKQSERQREAEKKNTSWTIKAF